MHLFMAEWATDIPTYSLGSIGLFNISLFILLSIYKHLLFSIQCKLTIRQKKKMNKQTASTCVRYRLYACVCTTYLHFCVSLKSYYSKLFVSHFALHIFWLIFHHKCSPYHSFKLITNMAATCFSCELCLVSVAPYNNRHTVKLTYGQIPVLNVAVSWCMTCVILHSAEKQ